MKNIRVSLFPCAYNEVDGVGNTMRHFDAFAKASQLPLLNIHGGFEDYCQQDGSVQRLELRRAWPKFQLDPMHDYDLNLWRYLPKVESAVRDFRPDLIHITGPSDVGQMGALIAHRLRIPLVASWHTNVHEYAERRLAPVLGFLPRTGTEALGREVRQLSLKLLGRFYRLARVLFAPNEELVSELQTLTGKRCYLMSRGIDTELFNPERRKRVDGQFQIGYVGRLTKEKNVRLLGELENVLSARTGRDFNIVVVGQGNEFAWLIRHLRRGRFAGVLFEKKLAEMYANFDVFAFPSYTDTFGNVVLEALAAGVPAVVMNQGGPRFIVEHEKSGFVAQNNREFIEYIDRLRREPELLAQMRIAARHRAQCAPSWHSVFSQVYETYEKAAFDKSPAALPAGCPLADSYSPPGR